MAQRRHGLHRWGCCLGAASGCHHPDRTQAGAPGRGPCRQGIARATRACLGGGGGGGAVPSSTPPGPQRTILMTAVAAIANHDGIQRVTALVHV